MEPELEKGISTTATSLLKYLIVTLFAVLPFVGVFIGYTYSPGKTIEVEKLTIETEKLYKQIAQLESELAETEKETVQEDNIDPLMKWPYTRYAFADGTSYFGAFLAEIEFTTGNATGSVLQVCERVEIIVRDACLGESAFILLYNNKYSLIEKNPFSVIGDEQRLHSISFNENSADSTTSTTQTSPTLIVATNPLDCLWNFEMCIQGWDITYAINLENKSIKYFDFPKGQNYWKSVESFSWNETGSKFFFENSCPAGCPDALLVAVDITTGKNEVLFTREQQNEGVFGEAEWKDENTILTEDTELTF